MGTFTRILVALTVVLGLSFGAVILAAAFAPTEPTGYGPDVESEVLSACRRLSDDEFDDTCACAYERLRTGVAWEDFVAADDNLSTGGDVPKVVEDAVAACEDRGGADAAE